MSQEAEFLAAGIEPSTGGLTYWFLLHRGETAARAPLGDIVGITDEDPPKVVGADETLLPEDSLLYLEAVQKCVITDDMRLQNEVLGVGDQRHGS